MSLPREPLSSIHLFPEPVCRNACDQDRDSDQSICREMKDSIDRHQPAHCYKENGCKRMAGNSVYFHRFTFTKDEDTARSQSEEDHVDGNDIVENTLVSSE